MKFWLHSFVKEKWTSCDPLFAQFHLPYYIPNRDRYFQFASCVPRLFKMKIITTSHVKHSKVGKYRSFDTHTKKETSVFPESTDTSYETYDEDDSPYDDEPKSWIKGDVSQPTNVVEHIFLRPCPQSYRQ